MYSIIGGILIFFSSIYIGTCVKRVFGKRCELLEEMPIFINFCDGEIAFYKLNIEQIFEKYNKIHPDSELLKLITRPKKDNVLYGKVLNFITQLTEGIKTLDRHSHKAFFAMQRNNIQIEIEKATRDAETRGKMAQRLTPLLGLGILILLI